MFFYIKKKIPFLNWQSYWYRIGLQFAMLSIICMMLVSGCASASPKSASPKQLYTNSEFGISLEQPGSWSLEFFERNGSIVMKAETGAWNKDSARIEIYGYACIPLLRNPEEELELNVNRIRNKYSLDSVTIIQEPLKTLIGNNEVTTTIISVSTMSLPEDSVINQVGERDVDIFQIIDMSIIRESKNDGILVYIYKGNNEQLNAEAEDIVDSIELICPPEP